jgi:hypothetical protein
VANLREEFDSINTISANGKHNLYKLLNKYENLFDDTLGDFECSDVKLDLKEAFPVQKNHHKD